MDIKKLSQAYLSVSSPESEKQSKLNDEYANFVRQRYNAMAIAKNAIRQVWEGTQGLYYSNDWEWIVKGEGFERPVRFTTLRDVTKSLTDVFMRDRPEVLLKAKDEKSSNLVIGKKAYIDHTRDLPHQKKVLRQVIEDMFFFGKGFSREMYIESERYEGLASRRVSPRDIFIDENANVLHDALGIDGARDVIVRDFMPLTTFQYFGEKYGWDTTGIVAGSFFNSQGLDYKVTNERENQEKTQVYGVKVYEYINWCEDLYLVCTDTKCVFEGKLTECQGTSMIPVVDYTFEPRNDSFWGNTLPMILAPHIYAKDTIFNLSLMNLKLTLQPVLAVSADFGFNKKLHPIGPGQVWQASGNMNGKVGDSIQPVLFGNPSAQRGADDMLQFIANEMSVASRSDIRNLEFHKDQTATQVLRSNQSMNAHNELIENIAEIESEAVKTQIWLDMLRSFMEEKDEDGNMRRVPIKNYMSRKNETDSPEFIAKRGVEDVFDLTEDMINIDCDVVVIDKRSEVAKGMDKVGRMMQAYPMLFNIAQVVPELAQKLDGVGMAEQLIEAIGLELERSFKKDQNAINDEFELLEQEIILGNNIVFAMEEERQEAVDRLNFLLYLRYDKTGKDKDKWLNMSNASKKTWQKALEDTFASIQRPRMQVVPEAATSAVNPVQPVAQQGGSIPTPNKNVMGVGGIEQTNLAQKAGSTASQLIP